jgi:cellulose biosynthesis protein BcsQ
MKPRKTRKEIAMEYQVKRVNEQVKRVNKIAEKLNKVMSNRKVVTIIKREETYTVFFKNGQKFIFTPYFPHRFHDNKIIPIHEGESYVKGK